MTMLPLGLLLSLLVVLGCSENQGGGGKVSPEEGPRFDLQSAAAYNERGIALYRQGDKTGALAALRHALRLDPDYAPAYYSLGAMFYQEGDADRAIEAYRRTIGLDSSHVDAHYNLGVVLDKKGTRRGRSGPIARLSASSPATPGRAPIWASSSSGRAGWTAPLPSTARSSGSVRTMPTPTAIWATSSRIRAT